MVRPVALSVTASGPAARATLAFFQLLLRPANAACSGHLLLGVVDPANELVARQRRDVVPGLECRRIRDERLAQVCGEDMHHPAAHSLRTHSGEGIAEVPAPLAERSGEVDVEPELPQ